jgi:hypothetical protein
MVIKIGQSSNGPLRSGIQVATEALNSLADNFNTVSSVALYSLIPIHETDCRAAGEYRGLAGKPGGGKSAGAG